MKEGKNLVIVESPGKIDKIKKALGSDYIVKASIGHIRDLDENGLSIDIADNFRPKYVVPAEKKKVVADLKKEAEKENWDELEKSVIASVADDVIVGVKGKKAEIVIIKKFA